MRFLARFLTWIFVSLLPLPALACDAGWSYGDPLQQEWPEQDRDTWYRLSQGSRLMPLDWYEALTLADGRRFAAREVQGDFALHFCEDTGRPVGFVVDSDPVRGDAIGLNCAACHTGRLTDGTHSFVVEGAPAMLDYQSYMKVLMDRMLAIWRDAGPDAGADWMGFADAVLGQDHSAAQATELQGDVLKWLQRHYKIQQSVQAGTEWGHGRTDAVAVIENTAASLSDTRAGTVLPPSTAPTSFPHVWNISQMRRVQWNGSAIKILDIGLLGSIEMGAVTRNVAEVLGVFAEVEIDYDGIDDWGSYPNLRSSVRMANMVRLERSLETLKSPVWPADAWGDPKADPVQWERGRALYGTQCAGCHSPLDRNDLKVGIEDAKLGEAVSGPVTRMVPIFSLSDPEGPGLQTDPMNACNALTHTSWAGVFGDLDDSFGAFRKLAKGNVSDALTMEKFDKGVPTLRLVEELALRMIFEKRGELRQVQQEDLSQAADALVTGFAQALFGKPDGGGVDPQDTPHVPVPGTHSAQTLAEARANCARLLQAQDMKAPEYKARPLNGIWSTAPFLHNGSVPTLADMLLPPDQRPQSFLTGAVAFDPVKVGLGAPLGSGPVSEYRTRKVDSSQLLPGNGNGGHAMPASATCATAPDSAECAADRQALLTYLKSL